MIARLDNHQDQAGAWDVISDARGAVAWNVGANIGQAARVLARNFDHILAFEPCVESYAILAAEMPSNVEAMKVAISSLDGKVRLDVAEYSINTGQLVTGPDYLPSWGDRRGARWVPCRSLDSLLTYNPAPDFLNIDVEAHEIEVLEGARRLFADVRPAVIVEVHRESHGPWIEAFLSGYDLTELRHGDYVAQGGRTYRNHFWISGVPK